MKLKIGIQRAGNIVFGRILQQDDSLRGKGVLETANSGIVCRYIQSQYGPQLQQNALFIHGANFSDNQWFACTFKTVDEAMQVVKDIKMLVAQVNQCPPETPADDYGLEVIE